MAMARDEVKTGRCKTERYQGMKKVLRYSVQFYKRIGRHFYNLDSHKITVATSTGATFKYRAVLGAQYHLVALSVTPVQLIVKDGQGYPVKTESFLGRLTAQNLRLYSLRARKKVDSKMVRVNSGETLTITVKGLGCAMVMIFRRFP